MQKPNASWYRFLKGLFGNLFSPPRRPTRPAKRNKLALEQLEGRVVPAGLAPLANNDTYLMSEGGVATGNVLSNDTDNESDSLSARLILGPAHGMLSLNSNGTFTYVHDGSEVFGDSFTYRANDGTSDSGTATVSFGITPINDAPVANADGYSIAQGAQLTVAPAGVLSNDTDAENNPLGAVLVTGPANAASFAFNSDGSFTYVSNAGFLGTDTFTYRANDGQLNTPPQTVSITVTPSPILFQDDFNRQDDPSLGSFWTDQSGDWQTSLNAAVSQQGLSISTVTGFAARDVAVSAFISIAPGSDNSVGLVTRYSGPGEQNFYLAEVRGTAGQVTVSIYRNFQGTYKLLAQTTPGGIAAGAQGIGSSEPVTGTLRFESVGGSHRLFLNDTLMIVGHDTLVEGTASVGIRSNGHAGITLDNFLVETLVPTQASLPHANDFGTANHKNLGREYTEQVGHIVVDNGFATNFSSLAVATLSGVNVGDMTLGADTMMMFGSGASLSLLGRYSGQGEGTGYIAEVHAAPGQVDLVTFNIYRRNADGSLLRLASAATNDNMGRMEFVLSGASLTLRMDGVTLLSAHDTLYTSGTAGLRLNGPQGGVGVDDFSVTAP